MGSVPCGVGCAIKKRVIEKAVDKEKEELREKVEEHRRELFAKKGPNGGPYFDDASKMIEEIVLSLHEYQEAKTVFCYVSMEGEVETRGIIKDALAKGKRVGVPLCVGKHKMLAKEIKSLEELKTGTFGIMEPDEKAKTIDKEDIDLAIIPCITCNYRGDRLGHGNGYYDRYLNKTSMTKCILNFDELVEQDVPVGERDVDMDIVITEHLIKR